MNTPTAPGVSAVAARIGTDLRRRPEPRAGRPRTAPRTGLVYANVFTSRLLGDVRLPLAVALLVVTRRTWVHFTVGRHRYAMPLALSLGLIGFFLWAAENAATFLRAWQYPSQESVWTLVHAAKLGSSSLLVVVGIVLVAAVKAHEGQLDGKSADLTVLGAGPAPSPAPRRWIVPRLVRRATPAAD